MPEAPTNERILALGKYLNDTLTQAVQSPFSTAYKVGNALYGGDYGSLGGASGAAAPGLLAELLQQRGRLSPKAVDALKALNIDLDVLGEGAFGLLAKHVSKLDTVGGILQNLRQGASGNTLTQSGMLADRISRIERSLEFQRRLAENPLAVPARLKVPAEVPGPMAEATNNFLSQIREARQSSGDVVSPEAADTLSSIRASAPPEMSTLSPEEKAQMLANAISDYFAQRARATFKPIPGGKK